MGDNDSVFSTKGSRLFSSLKAHSQKIRFVATGLGLLACLQIVQASTLSQDPLVGFGGGDYLFADRDTGEIKARGCFASLLPVIAVFYFALVSQDVLFSLGAGAYLGQAMVSGDPWQALLRLLDTDLPAALGNSSYLILIAWMMAAVVGAMAKSGGLHGFGAMLTGVAHTSTVAQALTALFGLVIFFDDYANTLMVGGATATFTAGLMISKEKLAFIVDCTSAPIASLVPISTWVGYEVGLIQDALDSIGSDKRAFDLFMKSIPYRFYALFMLVFVFTIIFTKREFGPMHTAERRARTTGQIASANGHSNGSRTAHGDAHDLKPRNPDAASWKAYNALLPIVVLVFSFAAGLYYSGAEAVGIAYGDDWPGVGYDAPLKDIVGNADPWGVLTWAAGATLFFQIVFYLVQFSAVAERPLLWPKETIAAGVEGTAKFTEAVLILVFAKLISTVVQNVKAPEYIQDALGDSIDAELLPVVIFLTGALLSFSTGTSWGTMAIMFPLAVPLADAVQTGDEDLLVLTIAAVLGGAIFGDHCSIISDTTVLSAAACQCPVGDHFWSQLPYAGLTGTLAAVLGYGACGYGVPWYACVALGCVAVPGAVYVCSLAFGGYVPAYMKGDALEKPFGAADETKDDVETASMNMKGIQAADKPKKKAPRKDGPTSGGDRGGGDGGGGLKKSPSGTSGSPVKRKPSGSNRALASPSKGAAL